MNWISLLFPKPHFDLRHLPPLVQKIHGKALLIAYYLTQTLALIMLVLVYASIVIPVRIVFIFGNQDLLSEKIDPDKTSYLNHVDALKDHRFERMF